MANVHIQSAAANLRKAVDDLKLYGQQIKAASEKEVRDMQTRIAAIKVEQNALNSQRTQTDNPAVRTEYDNLYQRLDEEMKDLEKRIAASRDNAARTVSQIDKDAAEFTGLANNLASRA